jgi:GH24 family phage-related lysozyme (muramidase)/uncharacterized protein YjbI with pentapeptide repeats
MRARQKVSRAGVELIKSFEGLRTLAARLPDGRWTLGYGHTFSAREGARVTQEDADALLRFDLLPVVDAINNLVLVPLNQNQFDSLVSFAFNIGTENFAASSVLKRINEGRMNEAALAMDSWRSAEFNGQTYVLAPLIRRRAAEKDLFLTPEDISHQAAALGRPVEDTSVEAPMTTPIETPPAAPDPALYHNPYATPAAPVVSATQRQIIDLGSPYSAPVEKPAEKPTIVRMADVSPYAPETPVAPVMSADVHAGIARAQEEQRQREESARAVQAVQAQAQAQAQAMAQAVAAARAVEESRQREEARLREEARMMDAQRMEAARAEQARQEAARREQERLDQWRAAEARIEQARLEQEQFEAARQELARQEAARQELERAEWAREQARLEQVRLEQARQQEVKWEQERLERVRAEQERAEQVRLEAARLEAIRLEQERLERAHAEQAHLEQTRLEQERIARERADQVRLEQEKREQAERDRQTAETPQPVTDDIEKARKAEAAAALMRLYSPYGGGNLGRPLTPNLFPAKPASQPETVTSTPVSTPAPEPVEAAPEFTNHSVISPSQVESTPFEVAARAEDLTPEPDSRPVFAPVPSAATMPPPVITALNPYAKSVSTPETAVETVVEVPRPAPINLSAPSNAPIAAEVGGLHWRDQLQRPLPQDYQTPASPVAAEPEQPFLRAGPSSNFQATETYEDDDQAWMMNGDRIALSSEEHEGEEKTWWQMIVETMWLIIFSSVGLGCLGFATGAWWQATHDQAVNRAGLVDTYTTVSIIMAAAGILFVSISVWLILKRLGGLKD